MTCSMFPGDVAGGWEEGFDILSKRGGLGAVERCLSIRFWAVPECIPEVETGHEVWAEIGCLSNQSNQSNETGHRSVSVSDRRF